MPAGIVPEGVYVKATLLQAVVPFEAIIAAGLMVTVTVNTVPVVHVPEVGVTL